MRVEVSLNWFSRPFIVVDALARVIFLFEMGHRSLRLYIQSKHNIACATSPALVNRDRSFRSWTVDQNWNPRWVSPHGPALASMGQQAPAPTPRRKFGGETREFRSPCSSKIVEDGNALRMRVSPFLGNVATPNPVPTVPVVPKKTVVRSSFFNY